MAGEVLMKLEEKIKKKLTCSICLETYTDPKLLQCFHVYCQQCLVPLVVRDQQRLPCPACRQVTPIPDSGVAGLQSAFQVNRLQEIQDSVRKLGSPATTPEGAVEVDATIDTPLEYIGVHCRGMSLPDSSRSYVTGNSLEVATVGENCTAVLHVVNFAGKRCNDSLVIRLLECKLTSNSSDTCRVERRGVSQYEISYQPVVEGRHQLHIKMEDQHVRGSPFSIEVKLPEKQLFTPFLLVLYIDQKE